MIDIDSDLFGEFVAEAVDSIPAPLAAATSNVEILIADRNPDEPDLLGLYEGVPLTERGEWYAGVLPDRVTVYRLPILAMCETVMDVVDEVRITVVHELAHHFGIDDDELDEWGWA